MSRYQLVHRYRQNAAGREFVGDLHGCSSCSSTDHSWPNDVDRQRERHSSVSRWWQPGAVNLADRYYDLRPLVGTETYDKTVDAYYRTDAGTTRWSIYVLVDKAGPRGGDHLSTRLCNCSTTPSTNSFTIAE